MTDEICAVQVQYHNMLLIDFVTQQQTKIYIKTNRQESVSLKSVWLCDWVIKLKFMYSYLFKYPRNE